MKIIRKEIFETNSSSSHSLVIKKREEPKEVNFPRNSIYNLNEYGVACCSEDSVDIQRLYSEVAKASYCVNVCATLCDRLWDRKKMFIEYDWGGRESDPNYMNQFWEEMINSDIFKTLKDVIYEETGTEITYVRPSQDSIPFYDCIYLEDADVEEMFKFKEDDPSAFKEYLKEVIFDKDIVIIDAEIPYGIEGGFDL